MRIGLDLTSGFLVFFQGCSHFETVFGIQSFITIEAYDRTRHYDLLVTNNPIHKKNRPQSII